MNAQDGLRIGARTVDFEPVPNYRRILAKLFEPAVIERRNLGRIERRKSFSVSIAPIEDGGPGESGLRAFEGEHLEEVTVIVRWDAPFVVVIVAHRRRALRPRADPRESVFRYLTGIEMIHEERTSHSADFNRQQTGEATIPRAVVLVEGVSDQLALAALAARRGRDLNAEGVSIVPMGGATNIARFLRIYGPPGLNVRLAGLCDVGEAGAFQRGLERVGLGSNLGRDEMERLGFYLCVADLEDELIRALGAAAVEKVIEAQGELESFRTFQRQPAWRGRAIDEQFRRFFSSQSSRKVPTGALLVDALDLSQVPRPLDAVLAHV